MILYFNFILSFWSIFCSSHLDSACDLIYWDENRPLVWSDFKGIPDSLVLINGRLPSAVSTTYIEVQLDSSGNYYVNTIFEQSESWVTNKSEMLLSHEQGHFDLTEIYSRKLRKLILDSLNSPSFDINRAYIESIDSMDYVHNLYDKQTAYGSIDVMNKNWQSVIYNRLIELNDYRQEVNNCYGP